MSSRTIGYVVIESALAKFVIVVVHFVALYMYFILKQLQAIVVFILL